MPYDDLDRAMGRPRVGPSMELQILPLWKQGLSGLEIQARLPGTDLIAIQRICKALAREQTAALVYRDLTPMVQAQIAAAKGVAHFFLRAEDGTFTRLTNPEDIEKALNSGNESSYYISTKDPSTAAFVALMDRTIDKPIERQEVTGQDGGPVELAILSRLTAARKRLEE